MFLDMVGFTAATHADEAATLRLLEEQEELFAPVLADFRGRKIKSTGDGFLAEFESALKATHAALEIQRRCHERNGRKDSPPIFVRIGVHLGDVEPRGSDIFGDAVNIAARIEPLARPGGICLSGAVYEQVRNRISERLEQVESAAMKGLAGVVEVYRVILPWEVTRGVTDGTSPNRLAVLPLSNISADPKDEYFADGLTEELITVLSRIRELRVIARTSVMTYKTPGRSVSQIGRELGVRYLLEGSVRKANNRLRITLQLIDVATQEHTWAESYDRQLDDVFAIQSEVAERTAAALRMELVASEKESIRKRPTLSLEAYNSFLKGLYASHGSTYEDYTASIRLLEDAIERDPDFVVAGSILANQYVALSGETIEPVRAFARARELVSHVLTLDPNSPEAHLARGNLAYQGDLDWAVAETEFRRAIDLNPSAAGTRLWYALLLRSLQRFEEAAEQARAAADLDPFWERAHIILGEILLAAGKDPEALRVGEDLRDRAPTAIGPHLLLAAIHMRAGRTERAQVEVDLVTGPIDRVHRFIRASLRAVLGQTEEARQCITELEGASEGEYISPWWLAALYADLGETEAALTVLERPGWGGAMGGLYFHYLDVYFDPIRSELRFQAQLRRLSLPTSYPSRTILSVSRGS
jgi:adenylate cyclase